MITQLEKSLGATVDEKNKRIYFWGGVFSQWYKCNIDDKFNCAEQAMMWFKAATFKDQDAMDKILETNDPSEQKAIGRTIKNYNDQVWSDVRLDVVTGINYKKFSQNDRMRQLLLSTDGYELVEASPYDKIWGVGLAENDPRILDKENWQGENLLGIAIMRARDMIMNENK